MKQGPERRGDAGPDAGCERRPRHASAFHFHAFDVLPVFRYLLSIAALIVALWLVETSISVLEYFGYRIQLPDTPWVRMLLRR